jgi:hypothetical protein
MPRQLALCSCVQQGSAAIVAVKEVVVASSATPARRPRSAASSSARSARPASASAAAPARITDGTETDDAPAADGPGAQPGDDKGKAVFRTGLKAQNEAARRKQATRILAMLSEARAIYVAADGALSLRAADIDIAMGDLLRCTGSADDSKKRYDTALHTLRTRGDGTEHIRTGNLLAGLAAIVAASAARDAGGRGPEPDTSDAAYAAVRWLSEAVAAYSAILPEDHPVVMTARARMAEQLDACGLTEDALAVYEQVRTCVRDPSCTPFIPSSSLVFPSMYTLHVGDSRSKPRGGWQRQRPGRSRRRCSPSPAAAVPAAAATSAPRPTAPAPCKPAPAGGKKKNAGSGNAAGAPCRSRRSSSASRRCTRRWGGRRWPRACSRRP